MIEEILDSWDRQASMVGSLAELVTDENRHLKGNDQAMALDLQLCHIHEVRYGWLMAISPDLTAAVGDVLDKVDEAYLPKSDLNEIRRQLTASAKAVRDAAEIGLKQGGKYGPYDNALLFIQHMVWHEGYHVGQIYLALMKAGIAPDDMWEEKHIWELWRGPDLWEG